jgi:hypothetical protein
MLLPVVLQSGAIILQALHGVPVFVRNGNEGVRETFLSLFLASAPIPLGWEGGKGIWLLIKNMLRQLPEST